jgi:AraC-like DNA-binding protein
MARPRLNIDPELIRKLAKIGCTTPEIASICGCSEDTIERRFAGILKKGRASFCQSLRRQQARLAAKGNATMLVWLGKQMLGQRDTPQTEDAKGLPTLKIEIEQKPTGTPS